MESDKLDANTICRTCMCEGTNMKSVFHKENDEKTVTELLEFIINISINSDDSLPKQICNECETFLHKADHFKRRCLDVELKFKELFRDNIPSTFSTIKHEDNARGPITDAAEPYQCSICSSKYAEITLLENHILDFHKLKKVPLFNELNLFSNAKAELITLETIPEKEEKVIKIVKQEFIDDFDNYSHFETEPEQIDFELNEDKSIINQPQAIEEIDKKTIDSLLKDKKHKCEKCNQEFKSANSLNIHKRQHEDKKPNGRIYQCSFCSRKFMSRSGLTNHLRCHEKKEDVKYTCGSCKREFKHKAHLDNHMVTLHANEKGFSCEFCSKNFATQESLEIHKDLHKIDKKHTCRYCDKSFYMLSTLTDHIRTHTGEKPYLCSTCGRGFSQKTNLAQHMRRHLGLKPFACDHCDHRFVSKGELVAHTRKHSGAHPFICDECGSGFTTSSSLVKHRRTHSGERPYACDLCHMRFAASGTLKNHRRTHTGEKPYQCSHCDKAFVQKNDLVSHVRWHTGERPYTCAVCGSSFHKPSALRSHAKMHTRDKEQLMHTRDNKEQLMHARDSKDQQLIPY